MQLIINVPIDKDGLKEFNSASAKVQVTLVKKYIDDLNIDELSKQKVVKQLLTTIKEKERKDNL